MMTPLKIALDSNAMRQLLKDDLSHCIYEHAQHGDWLVYLPVIVYAEQAVRQGQLVNNLVDAFFAQVISLERQHVDRLGYIWDRLRDQPRPGERPDELWKRHKSDWLIAVMSAHEEWLLVSDDGDFQRIKKDAGLRIIKIADFIRDYLTS